MPQMSTDMGMPQRDIYGEQIPQNTPQTPPPAPWQMPQYGNNQALNDWNRRFGSGSPVNYADENARNMAEGYANYFAIPYLNAQMADRTQSFNEYNTGRNFDEQVRLNSSQMDLANRGSAREDLALQYGQQNNVRDFGEAQRQFNEQSRIDEMYKNGQINAQQYANETARIQVGNEARQAAATDATNRYGMDKQYDLGMTNAANTRYGMTNDYNLGQEQNRNTSTRNANDYSLGQAQNANTRYGMDLQNQQFNRGDLTNRYGMDLQNQQFNRGDATNRYGMDLQNQQFNRGDATNRYGMDLTNQQQMRADATNRYTVDQSTGVAREQNANTRYGMDLQNQQQIRSDLTNRYGIDQQTGLGRQQDATNRYGMDQNYSLGLGQNANQAQANAALAQRYQGQTQNEAVANQNSLLNIQNQYALGQGALGFQNRELDTNEAYRRSQLSQEADLTREKFKNDLVQSRYSAFGRAAAPNARALRSWY